LIVDATDAQAWRGKRLPAPHHFQTSYRHEMVFIALDEDTGHMLGLVRLIAELDEK
jgi:hypothetical protein